MSPVRVKAPPATPWENLTLEWRLKVSPEFHWKGSLKFVLEASERTSSRVRERERPWPSPIEFLIRWAHARRMSVDLDYPNDLVTIRPAAVLPAQNQRVRKSDVNQPSLFKVD